MRNSPRLFKLPQTVTSLHYVQASLYFSFQHPTFSSALFLIYFTTHTGCLYRQQPQPFWYHSATISVAICNHPQFLWTFFGKPSHTRSLTCVACDTVAHAELTQRHRQKQNVFKRVSNWLSPSFLWSFLEKPSRARTVFQNLTLNWRVKFENQILYRGRLDMSPTSLPNHLFLCYVPTWPEATGINTFLRIKHYHIFEVANDSQTKSNFPFVGQVHKKEVEQLKSLQN